ncbi:MAG TPA: AbrB/MazE/SpoVT family DNA-binding domain-containing protein [Candidatus Bathyarchaeia archaeon]|nr:AbrB/MazE/SpoVT family DNA-binding domain-containing protein [Candidatus Bathyarchaeia archaeon]
MTQHTPPIKFKRKVNYNSNSYRVNIPLEIIEACNIKTGDILTIYMEGNKIIFEKTEE